MSYATSSAQPLQLYRYADVAGRIDRELAAEANLLGACLRHFEATCREPGYSIGVSHLADALRAHARAAELVDRWVQAVGRGFERADQRRILQALAQWVTGILATLFQPRSGGSYSLSDRYAGLTVQPRSDGPLSVQAQVIVGRLTAPRFASATLWLNFARVNWSLTRVLWAIRYLIFRFHWAQFQPPLWWPLIPFFPLRVVVRPSTRWPLLSWLSELTRPRPVPKPDYLPKPSPSSTTEETDLRAKPVSVEALLQTKPKGDESVLNLIRYEKYDDKGEGVLELDPVTKRPIRTVRDHIASYGCLLTSYTMLLQASGINLTVVDLYKKNYELRTGRDFDDDARDGNIELYDLYADGQLITRITTGKLHERSTYTDREHARENLRSAVVLHGPVIMHVESSYGDGHWVVVDGYDEATGLFVIRDPLRGLVKARIPEDYKPKGEIRYLESSIPR